MAAWRRAGSMAASALQGHRPQIGAAMRPVIGYNNIGDSVDPRRRVRWACGHRRVARGEMVMPWAVVRPTHDASAVYRPSSVAHELVDWRPGGCSGRPVSVFQRAGRIRRPSCIEETTICRRDGSGSGAAVAVQRVAGLIAPAWPAANDGRHGFAAGHGAMVTLARSRRCWGESTASFRSGRPSWCRRPRDCGRRVWRDRGSGRRGTAGRRTSRPAGTASPRRGWP